MPRTKNAPDSLLKTLREFGLRYPGAHTKSPWPGHLDLAVKDKTFAYMSVEGQPFSISCKLPASSLAALSLPFTEPTGWGLGKSGWVTAKLMAGEEPPVELFKAWIDESYRAQAPKRLLASLGEGAPAALKSGARKSEAPKSEAPKAAAPKAAPKKPAAKKSTVQKPAATRSRAVAKRAGKVRRAGKS